MAVDEAAIKEMYSKDPEGFRHPADKPFLGQPEKPQEPEQPATLSERMQGTTSGGADEAVAEVRQRLGEEDAKAESGQPATTEPVTPKEQVESAHRSLLSRINPFKKN